MERTARNSQPWPSLPAHLGLDNKIHQMLLELSVSYTDDPNGPSPVTAHQAEPRRFNCPLPCSDSSEHQSPSWIRTISTSEFKPGKPTPSPAWNSLENENQLFSPPQPLARGHFQNQSSTVKHQALHGQLRQCRSELQSHCLLNPRAKSRFRSLGQSPDFGYTAFSAEVFTFRH